MNESYLKINKLRSVINVFTAVFFSLFIAYHSFLAFEIQSNRIGRIIGLISFFLLTLAAIFALISKPVFRILRTVLMIAGLSLNFAVRLINAPGIFGRLNPAYAPSVLNCAIYVFSQLSVLILLVYYVVFRHNPKLNSKRKLVIALMSFVIALYTACLIMECVLIIKYRVNIDLGIKLTLAGRFLYFLGFTGIAVNFILPVQEIEDPNDLMNQPTNDEIVFSDTESSKNKPNKTNVQKRLPSDYYDEIVFTDTESSKNKPNKTKKQKRLPSEYYDEIVFTDTESSKNKSKKTKSNKKRKHLPNNYDDEFVI